MRSSLHPPAGGSPSGSRRPCLQEQLAAVKEAMLSGGGATPEAEADRPGQEAEAEAFVTPGDGMGAYEAEAFLTPAPCESPPLLAELLVSPSPLQPYRVQERSRIWDALDAAEQVTPPPPPLRYAWPWGGRSASGMPVLLAASHGTPWRTLLRRMDICTRITAGAAVVRTLRIGTCPAREIPNVDEAIAELQRMFLEVACKPSPRLIITILLGEWARLAGVQASVDMCTPYMLCLSYICHIGYGLPLLPP